MKRRLLTWLIEKLYRWSYEPVHLDNVNRKLIRPVPGLVVDGVQYWEFVNLNDMPRMRLVHYNYLREEMVMGLDRDLLVKIIGQAKEANRTQKYDSLSAILFMFEDIVTNITTVESLYNIASVVYFDGKEDIATYDYDYNQQKIARFKALKDKRFFFNTLLQQSLKIPSDKLPQDILQYLNENAVKLRAWRQILSEPIESAT